MSYETAIASAGGDDVVLEKSFIIACEGAAQNWYSLLLLQSVYSWVDLKTKLIQNFQGFHRAMTDEGDLFNCVQKIKSL